MQGTSYYEANLGYLAVQYLLVTIDGNYRGESVTARVTSLKTLVFEKSSAF